MPSWCGSGTRIEQGERHWPGLREGDGRESVTRSEAWLMGGHTPVVMVEGYAGGIALSHVIVPTAGMSSN